MVSHLPGATHSQVPELRFRHHPTTVSRSLLHYTALPSWAPILWSPLFESWSLKAEHHLVTLQLGICPVTQICCHSARVHERSWKHVAWGLQVNSSAQTIQNSWILSLLCVLRSPRRSGQAAAAARRTGRTVTGLNCFYKWRMIGAAPPFLSDLNVEKSWKLWQ